jgi:hypothetical protein
LAAVIGLELCVPTVPAHAASSACVLTRRIWPVMAVDTSLADGVPHDVAPLGAKVTVTVAVAVSPAAAPPGANTLTRMACVPPTGMLALMAPVTSVSLASSRLSLLTSR